MPNARNKKRGRFSPRAVWGLTGGFGSGKSTVLAMFRRKKAFTLDADAIVRNLLARDKRVLGEIRGAFGPRVFSGANLDKKALAAVVFSSAPRRRTLEKIVHPRVRREIQARLRLRKGAVAIVDIPLLYESNWQKKLDGVIVVDAAKATRIRRLTGRGFSPAEAERRIRAQMDLRGKVRRADVVVNNNGPLIETQRQVDGVWKLILNKTPGGK